MLSRLPRTKLTIGCCRFRKFPSIIPQRNERSRLLVECAVERWISHSVVSWSSVVISSMPIGNRRILLYGLVASTRRIESEKSVRLLDGVVPGKEKSSGSKDLIFH